jgi:hypothetical protein
MNTEVSMSSGSWGEKRGGSCTAEEVEYDSSLIVANPEPIHD